MSEEAEKMKGSPILDLIPHNQGNLVSGHRQRKLSLGNRDSRRGCWMAERVPRLGKGNPKVSGEKLGATDLVTQE